jgi:glyoxylase-like metal-dependent hydrolase (beta-lactamase superfamily II)
VTTGASARLDALAITHAHDDHIAGIGDLYDRYQVVKLWLPQHAKKLQEVAGNYAEFERVQEEHPDEQTEWPKGSRSVWKTLGENGDVSVRCFSPPGYIDPEEDLDEEEMKKVVHENCGRDRVVLVGADDQ